MLPDNATITAAQASRPIHLDTPRTLYGLTHRTRIRPHDCKPVSLLIKIHNGCVMETSRCLQLVKIHLLTPSSHILATLSDVVLAESLRV